MLSKHKLVGMYKWNSFGLNFNSVNPQLKLCQKTYRMYQPEQTQTVMGMASFLISKFTEILPFDDPLFFRQVALYLQLLQCPCYIGHFCRIKWIKCSQCHLLQDVPKTICDWPINKIKWKETIYGYEIQRGILLFKNHACKINISVHQPYNKLKSVQPPYKFEIEIHDFWGTKHGYPQWNTPFVFDQLVCFGLPFPAWYSR